MVKAYRSLAKAVFVNTLKDLIDAKKRLAANPDNEKADDVLEEIADFLDSDWASVLEGLSGGCEIEKIKEVLYE